MKTYALYKGDDLIVIGTVKEIAKETGVKPATIFFYSSAAYSKRGSGKNRRTLIKIDENEVDDD